MDEWLRWALAVPLAAALGALALVPPVPRWRRRVKRAHAMAEALPSGPERAHFEAQAIAGARLIINYTTMIPLREKAYSWFAVVLLGLIVAVALVDPIGTVNYFFGEGPFGWSLVTLGAIATIPAVFSAIAGRSAMGMDPEHYQDYLVRERRKARRQRVRIIARRRLRSLRRRAKHMAG